MATYDVTGPSNAGARPSRMNAGVRTPYLVENTIDVSQINSDAGAAQNDSVLTNTARPVIASADTLDLLVLDAASSAGKVRIFALLCDVSGVDETDRNSSTQHDG